MAAASVPRDVTSYGIGLAAPLALFFLVFFVAPLVQLFVLSLHNDTAGVVWGIGQYVHFLTDPFSLSVLGSTLLLGAEVTALCLVLGFPIAWLYHRVGSRAQTVIILIVLLPLLTSVVVRTFAWIVILGRQGIINSTLLSIGAIDTPIRLLYTQVGVVLALAQVQMPLMTLPLITALGRIDMNLEDASCSLGAGSWRTFWRVVLPLVAARRDRRLHAHLRCRHHGLHHAVPRRRRANALHADVSLPAGLDTAELAVCLRDLDHLSSRGSRRRDRVRHARPAVARIWWSLTDGRTETNMGGHQLRSRHDGDRADRTDRHHRAVARRPDRLVHQRILAQIPAARLFGAVVRRIVECVAIAFCRQATVSSLPRGRLDCRSCSVLPPRWPLHARRSFRHACWTRCSCRRWCFRPSPSACPR